MEFCFDLIFGGKGSVSSRPEAVASERTLEQTIEERVGASYQIKIQFFRFQVQIVVPLVIRVAAFPDIPPAYSQ